MAPKEPPIFIFAYLDTFTLVTEHPDLFTQYFTEIFILCNFDLADNC